MHPKQLSNSHEPSGRVAVSSKLQAFGLVQPRQAMLLPLHTPQASSWAFPPHTPAQSNTKQEPSSRVAVTSKLHADG